MDLYECVVDLMFNHYRDEWGRVGNGVLRLLEADSKLWLKEVMKMSWNEIEGVED